jgi:hypothetical protein
VGKNQLAILDSVGDSMCYGYGDGFRRATMDDSDVLIASSNGVPVVTFTKKNGILAALLDLFSSESQQRERLL